MSLADMFFKPALFLNPLITASVCIDHYVDPNIYFFLYSKEEDTYAFTSEQTTDIRTYVSNDGPSTSTSTCNQSQHVPVESLQAQTQSDDGQRMCDLEVKQLREMFPDCPENIMKEASERYVSLDSAVDFIMGNSIEVVSMCIQNVYCVAFS